MQNAEVMLTLNALVGLLKSLASAIIAFMKLVAPNVPTSKIAGDQAWGGLSAVRKIAAVSGAELAQRAQNVQTV